ncbi:glycopeptide antibiotics resistance protein [Lysinibacillus parviboronicapiens]|uniref:Glycopeptide antibiotics resistance protein n=1 Tax=Lysinibacillus parviboronicapiens TaxID=436516 RepID=A0ABV2PN98_9BACI
MSSYTNSIVVAALITILLSFVLFVPWLIYTYRKYNFLSVSKTIIMFSFIFYFLTALCLVLLPFPETRDTCSLQSADTVHYNLHPFQFMADIMKDSGIVLTSPKTWLLLTKQPAFFQAFFNFLLLMPFGVYLRYFLKNRKYWKRAFMLSFLLTLFYETTQVTGIYGIFNCAYRIFDVDDLMLNSIGALIGFFLAPIVWAMFPSQEAVEAKAAEVAKKDIVKPLSILLALVIDVMIVHVVWFIVGAVTGYSDILEFIVQIALYILIFGVVPSITNGATIGMRVMRFTMTSDKTKGIVVQSWRRCVAIIATITIFEIIRILGQIELDMDSPFYVLQIVLTILAFTLAFFLRLVIAIHVVRVIVSGGKRRLYIDEYANLVATRKK